MPVLRVVISLKHPALNGAASNTWHYRVGALDGPVGPDDALLGMSALKSFYNAMNDVLAGGTVATFDGDLVSVHGPSEGQTTHAPAWTSTAGTTHPPLPPSQCIVAGWGTNVRGKGKRGRTFVGPLGVHTLEGNGTPTVAALTSVRNGQDALLAALGDPGDGSFGLWSRLHGTFHDFTTRTVHDKFAVLRSRRD